jgi:hypothetical protein
MYVVCVLRMHIRGKKGSGNKQTYKRNKKEKTGK